MNKHKIWLGVLSGLLCGWVVAEMPAPATVLNVETPPVMDGKLDDPAWAKAETYKLLDIKAGGMVVDDTEFKLACDDSWLYIAVDCKNKDLAKIREAVGPNVTGHDQGACQDDSIEVFLDPGTDGNVYFHYMLSWAGAKDERRITGGSRETGWNFPWRSATAVNPDGWTAELALPLYIFTAFNMPEKFRFNITRNKRIPDIDGSGVIVAEKKEWRSFAPVLKGFHEPDRFVALSGIPDSGLQVPFLAELKKAEVQPYGFENGTNYYEVAVVLEGKNHLSGRVRICVNDQPTVGASREVSKPVDVIGENVIEKTIRVPVDDLAERDVEIFIKAMASDEVLYRVKQARPTVLKVMRVYSDRNYYTTEKKALVVCELGLPEKARGDFCLAAVAPNGCELGKTGDINQGTRLPIDLSLLEEGTTTVAIELQRKSDNQNYYSCDLQIIKRPPNPGCEWKIDHINRVVLNNGKPFFPIGLIMSKISHTDEKDFKRVADAGFNTYFQWSHLEDTEDTLKYLDVLKKLDMFYIESPDFHMQDVKLDGIDRFFDEKTAAELHKLSFKSYFTARKIIQGRGGANKHFQKLTPAQQDEIYIEYYRKNMPRILDVIEKVKDHSLLTSYFIMDEDGDRNSRAVGRYLYKSIHEADGYRPVIRNFSSYIGEITDCFDIIMTDPYWTPGRASMGARATPDFVAKITWMTYHRGEKYRQACWQTPVGNLWSGFRKRPLTYAEQLNQCHLAVIYGASGLFFFAYPFHYQEGWDAMHEVCRRFNVIGPLANGGRIDQTIEYETAAIETKEDTPEFQPVVFDYWKDIYPEVHTRIFQISDDEHLLMAANARYYPVITSFAIDGLAGTAVPLLEGASQAVKDQKFTETIEPLGTRVYKLRGVSNPVKMKVSTVHLKADVPPPETAWPHDYRPDRKNELLNPGFEEATVKGWPDYWFPSFSRDMDNMAGSADPSWGPVTHQPYHGKYCMVLRHPVFSTQIHCNPQNNKALPYTISFWARASRPDIKIWLYPREMERLDGVEYDTYKASKTFALTTEWERYELSALLPARSGASSRHGNMLDFRVADMTDGDTVWLDAVQFEKGMQATEYEE